jgi:hypothetical protein
LAAGQTGPDSRLASLTFGPGDIWPFLILAGIVACFLVRFAVAQPARLDVADVADEDELARQEQPERPGAAVSENWTLAVCNRSADAKTYVAVAYFDPRLQDYVARGWFPQQKDDCRSLLTGLSGDVFVYGESRDGRRRYGVENAADTDVETFCISGEDAFILPQKACLGGGDPALRRLTRLATFTRLRRRDRPAGSSGVLTWTIGAPADWLPTTSATAVTP